MRSKMLQDCIFSRSLRPSAKRHQRTEWTATNNCVTVTFRINFFVVRHWSISTRRTHAVYYFFLRSASPRRSRCTEKYREDKYRVYCTRSSESFTSSREERVAVIYIRRSRKRHRKKQQQRDCFCFWCDSIRPCLSHVLLNGWNRAFGHGLEASRIGESKCKTKRSWNEIDRVRSRYRSCIKQRYLGNRLEGKMESSFNHENENSTTKSWIPVERFA